MKACVFTLGCKMNEVESESLMRGLEERGFEVTETLGLADLYVLNTCAVTAEAEKKSRQAVTRMRKFNPSAPVLVCGCAAQNNAQAFAEKEGVTLVTGAQRKDRVLALLDEKGVFCEEDAGFCELPAPRRTRTRAYLRIQDGCNRFCSYCLIPYLRGRSRSRGAQRILNEARETDAQEIVLTGIDISSYRDGEIDLAGLVGLLAGVSARFRLGSLEPCAITHEFLTALKDADNFAPHFHLSLQSGSDAVLRAMNRRYTRQEYLDKCGLVYSYFPDAAITTDIIVGFPTETEEDFLSSLSIVNEAKFSKVHAFPFSSRKGTNAAKLKDIPEPVKKDRMRRMLEAAQKAEREYIARFCRAEAVAVFEADGYGYTENYIRVRSTDTARAREGSVWRVRLLQGTGDALPCELLGQTDFKKKER